jgi:small subunit ribosomal protein S16
LSVKIRLARAGAKKAPFYRVVAADSRSPRDGRFIEILGRYNPRTEPSFVELDLDRVDSWVAKGAQPTEAAGKLISIVRGEKEAPKVEGRVSKKVAAKAEAELKAADAAAKAKADEKAKAEAEASAQADVPAVEEPAAEASVVEPAAETPAVAQAAEPEAESAE